MIAATATNKTMAMGLVALWVVVRADAVRLMPSVKTAPCCQHVCDSRYADDMRRLLASSTRPVDLAEAPRQRRK